MNEHGNERARPFAELLRAVRRLLRTWWNGDRIRVSPREGRLFRLRAGDVVLVEGRPVRIFGRIVTEESDAEEKTVAVTYDCRGVGEDFRLRVARRSASNRPVGDAPAVSRIDEGIATSLDRADIEVFGGR